MTVTLKKRKFNATSDSSDIKDTADDFGQKYHCDCCSKDITHNVIIRCATCSNFDLCVECFRIGTEINTHKSDHPYRSALDFPIFERNWGADEELLLVEGLELFGIGNWEQIADHIGTKNKLECHDHYYKIYVNSENWPLPDMSKRIDTENGKRIRARPPDYQVKKLSKLPRAPASAPANHDIAGYMPGRKEFDQEFDNDAEQNVKDMEFTEEDTPNEIGFSRLNSELKCTMLNIYNTTLQRRAERKKLIFDRGLVDFRRILGNEKKKSKEEKDLYQKYRVFARMLTADDFDIFMDGLIQELKVRSRICQLQEYRRMGITTLKEAHEYDKEKANRAHNKSIGGYEKLRREKTETPPPHSRAGSATPMYRSERNILTDSNKDRSTIVSKAECFETLSSAEKSLCLSLSILPRSYLSIKDAILKEYAYNGTLKLRHAKQVIKIESSKVQKLYDFFVDMGWIS